MKTKLLVKNNLGEILQTCFFEDQKTMDEFIVMVAQNKTFGKPAYDETLEDQSIIHHEAEYIIEQTDITAEVELENLKKQYPPISPRQIRLALLSLGVTEAMVDAQINSLQSPDKEAAMIAWKYSTEFQRFIPMVEAIGSMLGLDANGLNALWRSAIDL